MKQITYWQELIESGIVALVGAGGKTTVLTKLVEYGLLQGMPTVVTTTTKLYESQVAQWNPYYGEDVSKAEEYLRIALGKGKCGAWFSGISSTKVQSVDTRGIDDLHRLHKNWQIVVEADGAKEKWLKAPKKTEPVIPALTDRTLGIINLGMLGKPLVEEYVHNLEEMLSILGVAKGTIVTSALLGRLVTHGQGLFQYSKGKRILFCTGYDVADHNLVEQFLDALSNEKFYKVVLAQGYKASCEITRVIRWQSV